MLKIGYVFFGGDTFSFGQRLINSVLFQNGYYVEEVKSPAVAREFDILMFSLFWWDQYYSFASFLKRAKISVAARKPLIVCGGMCVTQNPLPIANLSHYCFIGDGEENILSFIKAIEAGKTPELPGVWDTRTDTKVEIQNVKLRPFGITDENTQGRIEIARGCNHKCAFCSLSHIKRYQEAELKDIDKAFEGTANNIISAFAPNNSGFSKRLELQMIAEKYKKKLVAVDFRIDEVPLFEKIHKMRFGLEGLSYRLRKACGKDYSDDFVVSQIGKMFARHRTKIEIYMIIDLPCQRDNDFVEFSALLKKLSYLRNTKIQFMPNIFNPEPQTPLQWSGINLEGFDQRWIPCFRSGGHNIKTFHLSENIEARLKLMIMIRGNRQVSNILTQLKSENIDGLFKKAGDCGISKDYLTGDIPLEAPLPWDFIFNKHFPKEKLIEKRNRYYELICQ